MKNISLNLNNGEEILYVGQKDKYDFGWCIFYCISAIVAAPILIYLGRNEIYNYVLLFLAVLMFLGGFYFLYIYIRDYFTCSVFLTNQRMLMLFQNKLTSIEYADIYYITPGANGNGLIPSFFFIKLKSKKIYSIKFIKSVEFIENFKKIYSDYDDSELQERGCRIALIVIPLLLIIYILLRLFLK